MAWLMRTCYYQDSWNAQAPPPNRSYYGDPLVFDAGAAPVRVRRTSARFVCRGSDSLIGTQSSGPKLHYGGVGLRHKIGNHRRWRLNLLYRFLPKVWPTALGTDEGVRPLTGKVCTGCANLALKQGSKTAKIYSVGDPWTQNVGRTILSLVWVAVPPYPLLCLGKGRCRAPESAHTSD